MTSPGDLLVFLVTEGCLPMVAGERPRRAAPEGTLLTGAEREACGFSHVGVTLRYRADGGAVLADFGADAATLRLAGGDAAAALQALGQGIAASGRDVQPAQETPFADPLGRTRRSWFVRVSQQRWARVSALMHQTAAAGGSPLEVCVVGMEAIGQRSQGPN
jgi:hypothetical protein